MSRNSETPHDTLSLIHLLLPPS